MHQKIKRVLLCTTILTCTLLQAMNQSADNRYEHPVGFGANPYHAGPIETSSIIDETSHAKAQAFMKEVKAGKYGIFNLKGVNRNDVIEAVKHNHFDETFLQTAIDSETQDYYVLEYILKNSDPAQKEITRKKYIFDATSAPIAQLLMKYGAPTNRRDASRTLLHWACFCGNPSNLLEHYIKTTDLNINDDNPPLLEWADHPFEYPTPIQEQESQKKLKLLTDAAADCNRKDRNNRTALDIIKKELNDDRNQIYFSPTHVCAHSILAAQLIAAMRAQDKAQGINTTMSDVITDDGSTALHTWIEGMLTSCFHGNEREFKDHDLTLLLDAKVNCLHENKHGDTALDLLHDFTGHHHNLISLHEYMEPEEYAKINERLSRAMKDQEFQMMLSLEKSIVSTYHTLQSLNKSIQANSLN